MEVDDIFISFYFDLITIYDFSVLIPLLGFEFFDLMLFFLGTTSVMLLTTALLLTCSSALETEGLYLKI